jgi:hypothetical protein
MIEYFQQFSTVAIRKFFLMWTNLDEVLTFQKSKPYKNQAKTKAHNLK